MQTPSDTFTTPAPAPTKVATQKLPTITYEEVVRIARRSVLTDFTRQQEYRRLKANLRATAGTIDTIPTDMIGDGTNVIVKAAGHRLLKEHNSTSWSLWFFQWSVFGTFAVTSVAAVMSAYLGMSHNRMFLPFSPFCAVLAYKTWTMLENTWEAQRYSQNAALIRDKRLGNPLNSIPKGKEADQTLEEPDEGL